MPRKKSNLNNSSTKDARRKRITRQSRSAEQTAQINEAQRIRAEARYAQESREHRDERLRQNVLRARAARQQNINTSRARDRERQRTRRISRIISEPQQRRAEPASILYKGVLRCRGDLVKMETEFGDDDPLALEYSNLSSTIKPELPFNWDDNQIKIEDTSLQPYIHEAPLCADKNPVKTEMIPHDELGDTRIEPVNQEHELAPAKRTHTGEKADICHVCNTTLTPAESGERPYQCDLCQMKFSRNDSLISHKRIHATERPNQCDVCKRQFSQKNSMLLHRRLMHWDCDRCGKGFPTMHRLLLHKRVHTGQMQSDECDVCNTKFSGNNSVVARKRIQADERPYKCDLCKKTFFQKNSLLLHKRLMHVDKPSYECDMCQQIFSRKATFKWHQCIM